MQAKGGKKTLIFDFDGTLADTFGIAVGLFRKLIKDPRKTNDANVERLRGMSARQAMHAVGVRWWNLPYVLYLARKEVKEQMGSVKTFPGIAPVLRELHQSGHQLFILSSNSTKNIEAFLRRNNLEHYFDGFWGGKGVFAKAAAITKVIRDNNLQLEHCIYIGDEARDADAARQADLQFIGVTWGYNNHKVLQTHTKTLADNPKELLQKIKDAA